LFTGYNTAGKTKLFCFSPPLLFIILAPLLIASSIKSVIYLGFEGSGSGVNKVLSQGRPNLSS